jgi:hypothetical protein
MASKFSYSVAAASWIDAATGLPEVDETSFIYTAAGKAALTANIGYRFCNFMNVYIETGPTGRIANYGFYADSAIYRGPSFAKIPSHAFDTRKSIEVGAEAVTFRQIAGARTVSPEVIGEVGGGLVGGAAGGALIGGAIGTVPGAIVGGLVGGAIGFFTGRIVAHQVTGFPPIWSILEIKISQTGYPEARLTQHSLFPSLTYYEQTDSTVVMSRNYALGYYYNATKDKQLPDWKARGWGPLSGAGGPSGGNPWGIVKGVMGGSESDPN